MALDFVGNTEIRETFWLMKKEKCLYIWVSESNIKHVTHPEDAFLLDTQKHGYLSRKYIWYIRNKKLFVNYTGRGEWLHIGYLYGDHINNYIDFFSLSKWCISRESERDVKN